MKSMKDMKGENQTLKSFQPEGHEGLEEGKHKSGSP